MGTIFQGTPSTKVEHPSPSTRPRRRRRRTMSPVVFRISAQAAWVPFTAQRALAPKRSSTATVYRGFTRGRRETAIPQVGTRLLLVG